jgi:SAM-dependent methyltransferase
MTAALDVYAASLGNIEPLILHYRDGQTRELPVEVWTAVEVPGDRGLVDRCHGATLDIGCGPGRLVVAVASRGLPALGVDIAPGAVRLARARGALAITRSIFADVPGHSRWNTALLADGNVGIGGDPVGLLRRVRDLLAPAGTVLVELDPPGTVSGRVDVRMEHAGELSGWFPWAHLAVEHGEVAAEAAGFEIAETWMEQGRWFAALARG